MPEITNPAPADFALVTIVTDSGTLTVPCEPVNDWIAITPVFGMDKDGKSLLVGAFTLTHRDTGTAIGDGAACINCCRAAGEKLANLPSADWSALTAGTGAAWLAALDPQDQETFRLYRALEWRCDAEYCDIPADPRPVVAVDEPTPA